MNRTIEIKTPEQVEKINRLACEAPYEVWLSTDTLMLDARSLLGLMALILGSYRLSGFTVKAGNSRLFTLYTGLSVICSLTLLADGITPATCLTLGGAAALAGFCWTMREAA